MSDVERGYGMFKRSILVIILHSYYDAGCHLVVTNNILVLYFLLVFDKSQQLISI